MIKALAKLSTLLALGAFAATGSPLTILWNGTDSCGDTPACKIGQPGTGYTTGYCKHQYCDGDYVCPWNSTAKDFRESDRTLYTWKVGTTQYQCVSAPPTYSDTGYCCDGAHPGVIQSQPAE